MNPKKIIVFLANFLLYFSFLHSQTSDWSTLGNSGAGQGILGTMDQTGLKIATDGQTRMYVDPSGNIGIGLSNPTYNLQVRGDSRFNGALLVDGISKFYGNTFFNASVFLTTNTSPDPTTKIARRKSAG